jgi:hypothetical protein
VREKFFGAPHNFGAKLKRQWFYKQNWLLVLVGVRYRAI